MLSFIRMSVSSRGYPVPPLFTFFALREIALLSSGTSASLFQQRAQTRTACSSSGPERLWCRIRINWRGGDLLTVHAPGGTTDNCVPLVMRSARQLNNFWVLTAEGIQAALAYAADLAQARV